MHLGCLHVSSFSRKQLSALCSCGHSENRTQVDESLLWPSWRIVITCDRELLGGPGSVEWTDECLQGRPH